jgi:hypothetical protein
MRFVRLRLSKPQVQQPFESLRVTESITTGFKLKIKHALCRAEVFEAPSSTTLREPQGDR